MKKIKMTFYVISVLWIAVFTQVFVNMTFKSNAKITQAFAGTNSNMIQSEIQVIADYGDDYLSENDKKDIIDFLASAIGVNAEYEYLSEESKTTSYVSATKQSKNAEINIKITSIMDSEITNVIDARLGKELDKTMIKTIGNAKRVNQYIFFKLNIYENIASILEYKEIIENTLSKLDVIDYQTTIQFSGTYNGKLSLDEMNQKSNELLDNLQADVVSENREEEFFTIYAYTGMIPEYIITSLSRVNINIGMSYDEKLNQTKIYLATPIINNDF